MSKTKICTNCGEIKHLDYYYVHNKMSDGYLNKCKECVKSRVRQYWADGRAVEYDKKRQGTKKRREWQREYSKKMRNKFRNHCKCRSLWWSWFRKHKEVRPNKCVLCGTTEVEAHHNDYNKPFYIAWLCSKHHKAINLNKIQLDESNFIDYEKHF